MKVSFCKDSIKQLNEVSTLKMHKHTYTVIHIYVDTEVYRVSQALFIPYSQHSYQKDHLL